MNLRSSRNLIRIIICCVIIGVSIICFIFEDRIDSGVDTTVSSLVGSSDEDEIETYASEEDDTEDSDTETETLVTITNSEDLMDIMPLTGFSVLQDEIQSFLSLYGYDDITSVTISTDTITEEDGVIDFEFTDSDETYTFTCEYDKDESSFTFGETYTE